MQNEINELKKQVKPTPVTPEGTPVESAPSPVELKIQQLTEVGPQAWKRNSYNCSDSEFLQWVTIKGSH